MAHKVNGVVTINYNIENFTRHLILLDSGTNFLLAPLVSSVDCSAESAEVDGLDERGATTTGSGREPSHTALRDSNISAM